MSPSSYALIVLSEGAKWHGYDLRDVGEADAFGHRKKANIGEALSDEIKKKTGEETIVSDLTYDLRSGNPDFVDKMVASTFAGMAIDCIHEGKHGVMMGISHGCYENGFRFRTRNSALAKSISRPCTTPTGIDPFIRIKSVCQSS